MTLIYTTLYRVTKAKRSFPEELILCSYNREATVSGEHEVNQEKKMRTFSECNLLGKTKHDVTRKAFLVAAPLFLGNFNAPPLTFKL